MYSNSSSDWRSDGERGDDGDLLALQGYDDGSHKWFSSFPLVDYSVRFFKTSASLDQFSLRPPLVETCVKYLCQPNLM